MPTFTTTLRRFGDNTDSATPGQATLGWTYIDLPLAVTEGLKPGQKTSFRVRGTLDIYAIERVALIPMGRSEVPDQQFIMAINAAMRRGIGKEAGDTVQVCVAVDESPMPQSADLLACLADEPDALAFFQTLAKGHQTYFCQWVESAKTLETKTRRIAQAVNGCLMKLGYGQMIRHYKDKK